MTTGAAGLTSCSSLASPLRIATNLGRPSPTATAGSGECSAARRTISPRWAFMPANRDKSHRDPAQAGPEGGEGRRSGPWEIGAPRAVPSGAGHRVRRGSTRRGGADRGCVASGVGCGGRSTPASSRCSSASAREMLATARRYSQSPHDAEDAYQRAAEILLTHEPRGTDDELCRWLRTTVKHEALAIRRHRRRVVPAGEPAERCPRPRPHSPRPTSAPSASSGCAWAPRRSVGSSRRRCAACCSRRGLQLPRDLRGDGLVLHEGQPLPDGGPARVHRAAGRDRVGCRVRAACAPALRPGRRRGQRRTTWPRCGRTCAPASAAGRGCASTARCPTACGGAGSDRRAGAGRDRSRARPRHARVGGRRRPGARGGPRRPRPSTPRS